MHRTPPAAWVTEHDCVQCIDEDRTRYAPHTSGCMDGDQPARLAPLLKGTWPLFAVAPAAPHLAIFLIFYQRLYSFFLMFLSLINSVCLCCRQIQVDKCSNLMKHYSDWFSKAVLRGPKHVPEVYLQKQIRKGSPPPPQPPQHTQAK